MQHPPSHLWSAFLCLFRLLVRRVRPARTGIALLMAIPIAMLCAPQQAGAAAVTCASLHIPPTITATVYGTVKSGSYVNDSYTLRYTIDCPPAVPSQPISYFSRVTGEGISATLTIPKANLVASSGYGPSSYAQRDVPQSGGGNATFVAVPSLPWPDVDLAATAQVIFGASTVVNPDWWTTLTYNAFSNSWGEFTIYSHGAEVAGGFLYISELVIDPPSSAPVPEPSSILLVASGMIGIIFLGRRKTLPSRAAYVRDSNLDPAAVTQVMHRAVSRGGQLCD